MLNKVDMVDNFSALNTVFLQVSKEPLSLDKRNIFASIDLNDFLGLNSLLRHLDIVSIPEKGVAGICA